MQINTSMNVKYYTYYQMNKAGNGSVEFDDLVTEGYTEKVNYYFGERGDFTDYQELYRSMTMSSSVDKTNSSSVTISDIEDSGEFLGLTMVPEEGQKITYGVRALLSDSSTPDNPIVQVVSNLGGKKTIYNVEVNKVNPNNATQLEMFALLSYTDKMGITDGGTFGSHQQLEVYGGNASIIGYCKSLSGEETFLNERFDWTSIMEKMIKVYQDAKIPNQAEDCRLLFEYFTSATKAEQLSRVQGLSVEELLKAKYPGLVYNVGDGTSSDWRTRNDYPFEALFQRNEKSVSMIENWIPTGTNPKNQRYLAVAPGSKAVMIHPKAQERIEQDPEFTRQVMERIESWWTYDIARNEAILPGCTAGMSQAIAIGEDGENANVLACGGGEAVSKNKEQNSNEDEYDWWEKRHARHAMFMQLLLEGRTDINISSFSLFGGSSLGFSNGNGCDGMENMFNFQSGQEAQQAIQHMIDNGLVEKLGDTICGIPTEEVIETTWSDIEKGLSMKFALNMM